MPLASSGLRALPGRQASQVLGNTSRSIHIPAFIPRPTAKPSGSAAQTFFKQTRTFLTRFVAHLTTPGTFATSANIPQGARSIYAGPGRARTIQQGLSFPVRYVLSRPMSAPYLPRPPAAVPRSTVQVGLNTARNFSTARPIFQNIADNVPIAGRALWEADWDIKVQQERALMRPKKYSQNKENKRASKEKAQPIRSAPTKPVTEETTRAELDHYFPVTASEVTTCLLIPLAPTPTSRLPLPVTPSVYTSSHPLLPFSYHSSIHDDHGTHALRVSSMFARLDTARVFEEPGVSCSAYGDPTGLCTILEVKFVGWSEARVRSVLGECGTGWCVLEEMRENDSGTDSDAMDDVLSEISFETNPYDSHFATPAHTEEMDPSASFVMPTLDFSASFPIEAGSWSRVPSPSSALADLEFHNAWSSMQRSPDTDSDALSDTSLSDFDSPAWSGSLSSRRSSTGSDGWVGLGFSSTFSGRMRSDSDSEEPRESMF